VATTAEGDKNNVKVVNGKIITKHDNYYIMCNTAKCVACPEA
jgi:hypothetical protein